MAAKLDNLGYARVFRHPRTGELVVDTDSLRRPGGFSGVDFGADFDGDDDDWDDDDDTWDDEFEGDDFGDDVEGDDLDEPAAREPRFERLRTPVPPADLGPFERLRSAGGASSKRHQEDCSVEGDGRLRTRRATSSLNPVAAPGVRMGHVRDHMEAALKLAGLSESTRAHYIRGAAAFVKHFMRPPEELGQSEVWQFLLYQREVRNISVGRYLVYLGALRFLFTVTLQRPDVMAGIPWPKMHRCRPQVMTRDEVARVLDAARTPYWRTFLTTAYAAGLRRMEVAALRIGDIDSRAGLLRVVSGKGDKSREVMLDPALLERLRAHWRREGLRGPWLFPAQTRFGGWANHSVELRRASAAFRQAADKAALTRRMTLRSLRTAFATHLLEDGVDVFTLQQLLGHEQLETTARYAVVRTDRIRTTPSPLSKLAV